MIASAYDAATFIIIALQLNFVGSEMVQNFQEVVHSVNVQLAHLELCRETLIWVAAS